MALFPAGYALGPRVLVCGGRDYTNRFRITAVMNEIHAQCPIQLLVHGGAKGADTLSKNWAWNKGILTLPFLADWKAHGYSAGPKRNLKMFKESEPDYVIAFPGGKGTKHMVDVAKSFGCPVVDLRYKKYDWYGSL